MIFVVATYASTAYSRVDFARHPKMLLVRQVYLCVGCWLTSFHVHLQDLASSVDVVRSLKKS